MRCSLQDRRITGSNGIVSKIPVNGGSRPWVKAVEFVPYQVVEAAKHNHNRLETNNNVQESMLEGRTRLSGQETGVPERMPRLAGLRSGESGTV